MNKKMWKFIWPIIVACFMFFITETLIESERSEAFAEGYNAGYSSAATVQKTTTRPSTRPISGTILSGREYFESEITVTADSSEDYVVSLKDVYGDSYVSFYVRAGETVTVGVPFEYLYVYFACGDEWYGYGNGLMFGPSTYYSKDEELLDFVDYTWEYTLYPVSDGNFSDSPCSASEFF